MKAITQCDPLESILCIKHCERAEGYRQRSVKLKMTQQACEETVYTRESDVYALSFAEGYADNIVRIQY